MIDAVLDRTADRPSGQLRNMLTTVTAIARHWTGMSDDDFERLADWVGEAVARISGRVQSTPNLGPGQRAIQSYVALHRPGLFHCGRGLMRE